MAGAMRGSTRPRVTLSILREVEIPLPTVVEQARVMQKLDEKLAVVGQLLRGLEVEVATIESLPEALLGRAFADEP
jgi:restriction endonuclease S subunit